MVEEINKHPTQSSNHPNADVAAIREPKYPKILLLLPTISVVKEKKILLEKRNKKATENISKKGKPAAKTSKSKAPRIEGMEGITHQYQSSRW